MTGEIPLFRLNPDLDRKRLAERFARDRRVQIRDVLTPETAGTIYNVLARGTPWGLAWNSGDKPNMLRHGPLRELAVEKRQQMMQAVAASVARKGYGFVYHHYPLVPAYLEKWAPDGVHDMLLEHINDQPLLDLVRHVTGFDDLVKADATATIFGPNQFLGIHTDSHVAEGWRIAYVLNFTRDWHEDWGGYLLFYDEEGDVVAGYKPRFNALNLFAVPQRHSVSYVPPFSPVGRFAITGWFRNR